MKSILPALGAVLLVSACATSTPRAPTMIGDVVDTPLGSVRGETVTENGVTAHIYRGIPYAQPPVGELRWRAPEPAEAWDGVHDATEWPNRCPQGESSMGAGGPISEDCLYVNVVTAAERSDEGRPVMVFFHGGGLTTGTGNSTTYNHPMLPNKGVVVVTVNSRLGPIGYLAHPELSEETRYGSGNYGTLDLRASLQWVEENIEAFGGDPDNVTIFGESGGGTKTISQMATPLSEGLFDAAIVESGSALVSEQRITMLDDAEAVGVRLADELGASSADELRELSWQEIIAAADEVGFRANVVVDGYVIPEPVSTMFANGDQAQVPLIVGANQGERSLQTSVPLMANLHSAAGAPTYVYNFTQLPMGWREEEGCVAFHGLELTYVFGAVPTGLHSATTQFLAGTGGCTTRVPEHDAQDLWLAERSAEIWASFARDGDPSVPGLVEWPQYSEDNNVYLDIGVPLEVRENVQGSYVRPNVENPRF
ncbi:carboxylesterase family protein [Ponticaulis sp.]|uniref:carboxylesterase/lipase family protein n=1 Tax=Ponticaulis sp. TaxID=2020902 RepID=UPI002615AB3F|nr:carboxylesterase family protein [Ponticaulis sp.]MDF1680338.1 carboxylesterase family protein [Ponticaulis sp.]